MKAARSKKAKAGSGFQAEAEPVLVALRASLRSLVGDGMGWSELAETLGITQSVAWQVSHVASAEWVFGSVPQIPRPDAMARVLASAVRAGFGARVTDEVAASYRAFEHLVSRFADDRAAFDAMATGVGDEDRERADLPVRRAGYRANSQMWGFRAALRYEALLLPPGAKGIESTGVMVRGVRSLQWLRPSRPLPLGRRMISQVAHGREIGRFEVGEKEWKILDGFSSRNLPKVVTLPEGETMYDYISPRELGLAGALDYFAVARVEGGDQYGSREAGFGTIINTPCEECILDLIVPAGSFDSGSIDGRVYACIENVPRAKTMHPDLRLAGFGSGAYLGSSIEKLRSESFAECPKLIRGVLKEEGWESAVFDVFRYRLRYPMLHTFVSCSVMRRDERAMSK